MVNFMAKIKLQGISLRYDGIAAKDFYNFHRSQFDRWEYGEIKKVWTDADGNTCIRYASGKWWHYTVDSKGNVIFW